MEKLLNVFNLCRYWYDDETFDHCLRVALYAAENPCVIDGYDKNLCIMLAMCHDLLEDTSCKIEEITKIVGDGLIQEKKPLVIVKTFQHTGQKFLSCRKGKEMTDREKLIELLNTHCDYAGHVDCKEDCAGCLADHLIANGVTFDKGTNVLTKWIPVSERLPGDDETVLCYRAQDDMRVAELLCGYKVQNDAQTCNHSNRKDVAPFINREWNMIFTATHWLPIPDVPEVTK